VIKRRQRCSRNLDADRNQAALEPLRVREDFRLLMMDFDEEAPLFSTVESAEGESPWRRMERGDVNAVKTGAIVMVHALGGSLWLRRA
jgi:hypothetical protein